MYKKMLERQKKGQVDALGSGRNLPTIRKLSKIIFLTMDHGCQITKCFIKFWSENFKDQMA